MQSYSTKPHPCLDSVVYPKYWSVAWSTTWYLRFFVLLTPHDCRWRLIWNGRNSKQSSGIESLVVNWLEFKDSYELKIYVLRHKKIIARRVLVDKHQWNDISISIYWLDEDFNERNQNIYLLMWCLMSNCLHTGIAMSKFPPFDKLHWNVIWNVLVSIAVVGSMCDGMKLWNQTQATIHLSFVPWNLRFFRQWHSFCSYKNEVSSIWASPDLFLMFSVAFTYKLSLFFTK